MNQDHGDTPVAVIVNCHATYQSRSRMACTVQLITHIGSKDGSWRDGDIVCGNTVPVDLPLQPSPFVKCQAQHP